MKYGHFILAKNQLRIKSTFIIKNTSYIATTASYLDQHRVPIMNEIDDFIFRL
jgi:hypothetical protein